VKVDVCSVKNFVLLFLVTFSLFFVHQFAFAQTSSPTAPASGEPGSITKEGGTYYEKAPFEDVKGFTANFGVKIGYGFRSALVTNHSSTSSGFFQKNSLAGGIYTHFSHVDFVRLQIEALYMQKGFQRSNYQANLETFTFPLLVRIQVPLGIFFNAGFGISYIFDGTVKDSSSGLTNLDDYFERLGYELHGGIGWEMELFTGGKVFVEARVTYDLKNMSTRYPESTKFYNIHLFVGFQI